MATKQQFMYCRVCGTRLKKSEVDQHEAQCLEKSETSPEKDPSLQAEPGSNDSPDEIRHKTGRGEKTTDLSGDQGRPSKPRQSPKIRGKVSSPKDQTMPPEDPTIQKQSDKNNGPDPSSSTDVADMSSKPFPAIPADNASRQRQPHKSDSLPMNALKRDEPKQAWNAKIPRKMSGSLPEPFPKTKKYRHYPVSCEFCNRKFQPGPLRKHVQKVHPDEHLPPGLRGTGKIAPPKKDAREPGTRKKSPGGMPRQLKICYICGKLYGSKSLPIHESKCIDKWRVENERLPKNRRMPEPVKPEPIAISGGSGLTGSGKYNRNIPDLDPEAEAAYQSHLRNLIPCMHCKRTFNPDRVLVHENSCVERPRRK